MIDHWFKKNAGNSLLFYVVAFLVFIVLNGFAWQNRFLQDDAYISFHYAQNLVEHGRLTYNPTGEFVEGYSNFLWTILMAVGLWFGIKPETTSQVLGLLFWNGALLVFYSFLQKELKNSFWSLLGILLLGLNYSVSIYATGGLETSLQLFLTLLVINWTWKIIGEQLVLRNFLILSLIYGIGCLNRMDFALVVLWSGGVVLYTTYKQIALGKFYKYLFALGLPGSFLIVLWLSWKLYYYGDIFPNTFYAKVGQIVWRRLAFYLGGFLGFYFLIPSVFTWLLNRNTSTQKLRNYKLQYLLIFVLIWLGYLAKIGGDFMEFRMMLPILPIIYFLLINIWKSVKSVRLAIVMTIYLLTASFIHGKYYKVYLGIESKDRLADFVMHNPYSLVNLGKKLGKLFDYDHTISAGVVSAGAIVYHAKFHALDLLGLNDRYIAKHGRALTDIPGHQKIAPLSYLYQQKLNIVVGSAVDSREFSSESERFQHYLERIEYGVYSMAESNEYPQSYRIVEIPLSDTHNLYFWYLHPHSKIDELIQLNQWIDHMVKAKMKS